jgi:hypothetical protein
MKTLDSVDQNVVLKEPGRLSVVVQNMKLNSAI